MVSKLTCKNSQTQEKVLLIMGMKNEFRMVEECEGQMVGSAAGEVVKGQI